jgi:hypothetical protein
VLFVPSEQFLLEFARLTTDGTTMVCGRNLPERIVSIDRGKPLTVADGNVAVISAMNE